MGHVTTLAPLARCTAKACPWRFTDGGPDRACPDHAHDGSAIAAAAKALGIELGPAERDSGDDDA